MKTLRLSPVTRLWSAVGKTRRVWWPGELQLIRSLMCFALMKQVGGSESIIFHPGIIFFNTAVRLKQNWNFKHFGAFWLSNLSCTDAAAQMRTTTDSPLSSSDYPERTYSPSTTASLTRNMPSSSSFTPSPPSSSSRVDTEVESALFISSTKDCFGGLCLLRKNLSYINKTLTDCSFSRFPPSKSSSHHISLCRPPCCNHHPCISETVSIFLIYFSHIVPDIVDFVICLFGVLFYLKRRRNVMSAETKQPEEESIQTEEWTCAKNAQETRTDERIEVDNACQTDV